MTYIYDNTSMHVHSSLAYSHSPHAESQSESDESVIRYMIDTACN